MRGAHSGAEAGAACSVLIVDDDEKLRSMLAGFLSRHGVRVSSARDAREMHTSLKHQRFDAILLDVMLPDADGLSLCRELSARSAPPVILLTALGADHERVLGLETGADDYIVKPFNPRELLARVRAIVRRTQHAQGRRAARIHRFSGWTFNAVQRTLTSPEGALTELTSGEFDLLQVFIEFPQRVLGRDQLLDMSRGRSSSQYDRSIDVQISRLRRKIERDPQYPALIKTIRNEGYFFAAEIESIPSHVW